ncbi:hypothetical protein SEA_SUMMITACADEMY_26 [Gordonia phage SummitAcademy]|nr:hypothetical protein SEA_SUMMITACADEMY_26 [Gordonia phage SummitAcademy]
MKVFTAQDIVDFYSAGSGHWFLTEDGDLVIHDTRDGHGDELFLMSWDQLWFEQWGGEWSAAAQQLNETLERTLQELRGH